MNKIAVILTTELKVMQMLCQTLCDLVQETFLVFDESRINAILSQNTHLKSLEQVKQIHFLNVFLTDYSAEKRSRWSQKG